MSMLRVAGVMLVLVLLVSTVGCKPNARALYQQGLHSLQAQEYDVALEKFEESVAMEPSNMALFGIGRSLYGLGRYDEALPVFEQFLVDTDSERATYRDERSDAEFYRDKCKIELGIEVPQNPDNIPPPRMGG